MMNEPMVLFKLIRDFLTIFLPKQKMASPNTIKSYRNTLNLFLGYASDKLDIALIALEFQCLSRDITESFLDWLEDSRGYSIASRNQRLAALRSFYRYAAGKDATLVIYYQELLNIPKKKQNKGHEIEFFSENVLQIILNQPDTKDRYDMRNLMYMILLYDTGARVQEILDLQLENIHLAEATPYLVITGKGRKTRLVPIMKKTVEHLKKFMNYYHENLNGKNYLFYISRKGNTRAMSPDNVGKFIKKYAVMARSVSAEVPDHLYPHMFRHSRAMHLYRSGMPLPLLSEWLGHAQMNTTITYYANADIKMKQEAIESATSSLNPLFNDDLDINWENDEEMMKKLCGLV
ncbi:MAG: tyrosine-type recombinase/integrase [Candidatus Theseobacter exili]|nr:tyrosine-type recombinase/integrase [Candidatus Theseobacter exili]